MTVPHGEHISIPRPSGKVRVCHLTTVHGAFDDRIFFKQCTGLVEAGYEVIEVAPHGARTMENGVLIEPLRVPGSRLLRATWGAWRAFRTVRKLAPRLVHIHDPELLPVGFLLKWSGIRVVFDMHELISAQILDKTWIGPLWLRRGMSAFYGMIERAAVERFDGIVLAESRYLEEMLRRYDPERDKFTLVRNFPVLSVIRSRKEPVPREDGFTVIYVGGLSGSRGIDRLIEAVAEVGGTWLWLVGAWASEAFRQRCEALPGYGRVRYKGQVRMDEVYEHIRAADLGACVLHPLPNYTVTEPIKTYEYLACDLPLLLSDFPYWRDRFGQWAWFVDPMDTSSIANGIRMAQGDPEGRRRKAEHGRRVVEQGRSWEHERQSLFDLYQRLLA